MLFLTQKTHSAAGCTDLIQSLWGKSINTLTIASSPSIKQGEINHSEICADLWYEAFPFITEIRHTRWVPQMVRGEREEAVAGDAEKRRKPAMSTKLSGSDLRNHFGEGFDYFSPYLGGKQLHWQSIHRQTEWCFHLCCHFACARTPLSISTVCSFKPNSKPQNSLYSAHCGCNTNRNWSTVSIWSCVSHRMESTFKLIPFPPLQISLTINTVLLSIKISPHQIHLYRA